MAACWAARMSPSSSSRLDQRQRGRVGLVGEGACPADVRHFLGRLHDPQACDQRGCVFEDGKARKGGVELPAVRGDEAVRLVLDAEALARKAELRCESLEVEGRIGIGRVLPDADVLDRGGMLRLAQIGRSGEERHAPVRGHDQALEEAEAEGVVARQPIHGFLLEQQHPVEPGVRQGGEEGGLAALVFRRGEMQGQSGLRDLFQETRTTTGEIRRGSAASSAHHGVRSTPVKHASRGPRGRGAGARASLPNPAPLNLPHEPEYLQ